MTTWINYEYTTANQYTKICIETYECIINHVYMMEHLCTKTACTKWNISTCTHEIHDWEAAFWLQLCYRCFFSTDGRNQRFYVKTFVSPTRCEHQIGYIRLTLWRSESRTRNSWQNIFGFPPTVYYIFYMIFVHLINPFTSSAMWGKSKQWTTLVPLKSVEPCRKRYAATCRVLYATHLEFPALYIWRGLLY